MKNIKKIITLILIQSFLLSNIALAGEINLSPHIQVEADALKSAFTKMPEDIQQVSSIKTLSLGTGLIGKYEAISEAEEDKKGFFGGLIKK